MLKKVLLSLAVVAAFAFAGSSSAEAGGCYRGGGGYYRGPGPGYGGGHYRAARYYGGPAYYGHAVARRSYYGPGPGYGYYARPRSGISFSIGF